MQNFVKLILRRQAEEIRCLKREIRRLKRERRAYRQFYLKVMTRYCGLVRARTYFWDFLEAHRARDPGAILGTDGSEEPGRQSSKASLPISGLES